MRRRATLLTAPLLCEVLECGTSWAMRSGAQPSAGVFPGHNPSNAHVVFGACRRVLRYLVCCDRQMAQYVGFLVHPCWPARDRHMAPAVPTHRCEIAIVIWLDLAFVAIHPYYFS